MLKRLYTLFGVKKKTDSPTIQLLLIHRNLNLTEEQVCILKQDLYKTLQKHLDTNTESDLVEHRRIS